MKERRARGRMIALLVGAAVVLVVLLCSPYWNELVVWYRLRGSLTLETLRNEAGCAEFRHRATGLVLVLVPGGTFLMGSPADEAGAAADEHPPHEVFLKPFLVAKYEVTQAAWRRVMGDNPSTFEGDDLPVETVSWNACDEFCRKSGLQLPTEAQWEFACRAGTDTPFAVGRGSEITTDLVVFGRARDSGRTTAPVGTGGPNGFGLYNMPGNVREWCRDAYESEFYSRPQATGTEPVCTSGRDDSRVIRGGEWRSGPSDCRSARRLHGDPTHDFLIVGLRPVHPVSE